MTREDKKEEEKKEEEKKEGNASNNDMIAKRDFHIFHNEINIKIKKGDDVAKLKLSEKFIINLITEKIINEV